MSADNGGSGEGDAMMRGEADADHVLDAALPQQRPGKLPEGVAVVREKANADQ